jgi:hypothetical protein
MNLVPASPMTFQTSSFRLQANVTSGRKEHCMTEFRLTQISDTHLARRYQKLTDNFDRVREYIDAKRPDLVVNSGDLAFDGPTNLDDLEFAKTLHDALVVPCRIFRAITMSATIPPKLARRRRNRSPNKACRHTSRSSVKTAGALTPPAGVSSALIHW